MAILVVAETRESGLHPASVEAIVAARQLGGPIELVVPGHDVDAACHDVSGYDLAGVTALTHRSLAVYAADAFVAVLAPFITERAPEWVVCPHTYRSRDFVPALAARLDRDLVTDCTAIAVAADGVRLSRSMFRGKLRADVVLDGPPP